MDWFWEAVTSWLGTSVRPPYAVLGPIPGMIVTLLFGFVGVLLVRQFLEGEVYFLRWWSFRLGDSIAIGLFYAFFAGRALRDYEASGWYTQRWVYLALVVMGLVVGWYILWEAVDIRSLSTKDIFNPSELFHTFITWPALTLLVGSSIIPIWASDSRLLYKVGATLGLVLYFITVGYDMFLNPHRMDPGR